MAEAAIPMWRRTGPHCRCCARGFRRAGLRAGERLALGTVQFGLPYGVANSVGQISAGEAARIVARAREAGIDTLDTAISYGDSEACLGRIGVAGMRVITKLPPVPEDCADVESWVEQRVAESMARLRTARLAGVLLHRPGQLLGEHGAALYRALRGIQQRGLTDRIGVSIYDPEQLAALWPRFQMDLVQAPLNIIDRRMVESGWLARLAGAGVQVHARSVFLQGLLLMPAARRPRCFARWQVLWDEWEAWLAREGVSALQACLGYVLSVSEVARVVVGVDGVAQLEQVLAGAVARVPAPPRSLVSGAPDLIDPSRWSAA
jgi:aryl-alcohol dehydrogenase-like predicted oxidoreductase